MRSGAIRPLLTVSALLASALIGRTTGAWASAPPPRTFDWHLPAGFPEPVVPDDNPISAEKVELGRHLFYDTRLSGNGTFACASCHKQEKAFADALPRGVGSTGQMHPRGSMSLGNIAYSPVLT